MAGVPGRAGRDGGFIGGTASAATDPVADGTLIDLHTSGASEYALGPYDGTYGHARAAGDEQDPGDYSDPDGMLEEMATPGGVRVDAAANRSPVQAEITGDVASVRIKLAPSATQHPVFIPPMHNYARCGAPGTSLASVQMNGTPQIAGQAVNFGTTEIETTGDALGLSQVGRAHLTARLSKTEYTDDTSAHARLVLEIDQQFYGKEGQPGASGKFRVVIGDVRADCAEAPPTTSPSPPTPSETGGIPEPTTTEQPTTTDPTTTEPTTTGPTTTLPSSTGSSHPPMSSTRPPSGTSTTPSGSGTTSGFPGGGVDRPGSGPPGAGDRPDLATTGSAVGVIAIAGVGALCGGLLLLQRSRLRRSSNK